MREVLEMLPLSILFNPTLIFTNPHQTYIEKISLTSAVTIAGAAGAMHRGPSMRGAHISTFYCKIFSLKAQVNLLLLNLTLHQ